MADLLLENIGKTFPPAIRVLDNVSLTVAAGECLALVGPSGCGKTTLLRVIAGLERQTEGNVILAGDDINETPSHRRGIALLMQRPAFLLSKSVRQNLRMAWTLREPLSLVRRLVGARDVRESELARMARLLDMESDLDRPLQQLSGGQQQRVALGRCLLRKAKLTLLDEPLGHLDAPLRTDLRRRIRAFAREFGLTLIYVTHDPAEALAVGDRVAVMREGRIVQTDEPQRLRRFPGHRFVAELMHHETGGVNFLLGEIVKDGIDAAFVSALGRWPITLQTMDQLRESLFEGENFHANQGKGHIILGVPAAEVRVRTAFVGAEDDIRIHMNVQDLEFSAGGNWVVGAGSQHKWVGKADKAERLERGGSVVMAFSLDKAYWFDSTTGRTLLAPTG